LRIVFPGLGFDCVIVRYPFLFLGGGESVVSDGENGLVAW